MLKRIGKKAIIALLLFSGIVKLRRFLIQRNNATIFILHDPNPEQFRALLKALNRRYTFVSMELFISLKTQGKLAELPLYPAVLTFDDGHMQNFELLDAIVEYKTPTTIFACSDIVNTNRHFWSNYGLAKQEMEGIKKLPNQDMLDHLVSYGYQKTKQYDTPQALSLSQMKVMEDSGFVSFESHTCFHPILTQLNDQESKVEIKQSKLNLEALLDKPITGFAFPNGDYGQREIDYVKEAGYTYSVTVEPGVVRLNDNNFTLKRICLNDFGSLGENIIKATGLWKFIKG